MLGFYLLLLDDIRHETGLTTRAIARAFDIQQHADFARFDATSSVVWVHHMARFRLGLKPGQALGADDNRVIAVNRLYQGLVENPWLGEFFDQNTKSLRLKRRRESVGLVVPLVNNHYMSGLPRGYQGACKPVIRDQGSEIRGQKVRRG